MKKNHLLIILFLGLLNTYGQNREVPNIIIILADDMGFSDLGCTGAEIKTPNLDNLANNGALFTNFYNTSRCSPSRASLLTGLYQHKAGVGHMTGDRGLPAYQGHLNDQSVTIAEVLNEKGYRTIMAGKWHIGNEPEHWPEKNGFERVYSIPKGGGLYFYPSEFIDREVYKNGEKVVPDPSTFYSTDNFTEEAIGFIKEAHQDEKPFFLYLPYIAPHYPLQAWPEDIEKYKGKYKEGYDAIRQKRFQKQKALGIINHRTKLSPADYPSWSTLGDPGEEERRMEVYAAQMDRMDQNIGKLVSVLQEMEVLDNTIIMFMSDNGACAEEVNKSPGAKTGTPQSFVAYGENWANVSNTPYRLYKSDEHEGGIITPLIVHWPAGLKGGEKLIKQPVHIIDVMPTILQIADATYPSHYSGNEIVPMQGMSFLPLLKNSNIDEQRTLFWEHEGNQAVRRNNWKLVRRHNEPWELFNLDEDPTELNDLSDQQLGKVEELKSAFQDWAKRNGVKPWPVGWNN